MSKVVLSLVGKQGTGKSTLAKKIAHNLNTIYIETSDVVQEYFRNVPRKELTMSRTKTHDDPEWLGKDLYSRIFPEFKRKEVKAVVLSGVREIEVHKYLERRNVRLVVIEIISDPVIRCKRLIDLGTVNSVEHFIDQDLRERQMGLDEVSSRARFQVETSEDSSPTRLTKAIISKLVKEGYTLR